MIYFDCLGKASAVYMLQYARPSVHAFPRQISGFELTGFCVETMKQDLGLIGIKQCTRCKEWKSTNEFFTSMRERDRLYPWCKKCKDDDRRERYIKNPETQSQYVRNRRARMRNCEGTITNKEWEALKKKYNYTCLCCGRQEPEIKLTLDHVIPIAVGGRNTIDNAQPLCRSCNSRKCARMYTDYR